MNDSSTEEEFATVYADIDSILMFIKIWLPLIIIFGVAGNVLILIHFIQQKRTRKLENRLLITMTICDIATLLNYPLTRFVMYTFHFSLDAIHYGTCFFNNFMFWITMDASRFIVSFLAIVRLISIKYPLEKNSILKFYNLVIIFSVAGVHTFIKAMIGSVPLLAEHPVLGKLCGIEHYEAAGYYHFFYFLINYGLLVTSNCYIYYKVRQLMNSKRSPSRGSLIRARMLIALSFLFFIFGLPIFPFFILTHVRNYSLYHFHVLECLFSTIYFSSIAFTFPALLLSSKQFKNFVLSISNSVKSTVTNVSYTSRESVYNKAAPDVPAKLYHNPSSDKCSADKYHDSDQLMSPENQLYEIISSQEIIS